MREYDIAIEHIRDVKDSYLSKDLATVDRWNKLTVADEDPEFLENFNSVISDGYIPNGEEDNDTYGEEK